MRCRERHCIRIVLYPRQTPCRPSVGRLARNTKSGENRTWAFWPCTKCRKRPKKGPVYTERRASHTIQLIDYAPAKNAVMDLTIRSPTECPTQILSVRRIDRLARRAENSCIHIILKAVPTWGTITIHHTARRPSSLRHCTSLWNTSRRCERWLTLDATTSVVCSLIVCIIAKNVMTDLSQRESQKKPSSCRYRCAITYSI